MAPDARSDPPISCRSAAGITRQLPPPPPSICPATSNRPPSASPMKVCEPPPREIASPPEDGPNRKLFPFPVPSVSVDPPVFIAPPGRLNALGPSNDSRLVLQMLYRSDPQLQPWSERPML